MKVFFNGNVTEHTSGEKIFETAKEDNIRSLIDRLSERFGGGFKDFLLGDGTCFFLVNGSGIMMTGGLRTPLKPGDTVEVMPFVDGG